MLRARTAGVVLVGLLTACTAGPAAQDPDVPDRAGSPVGAAGLAPDTATTPDRRLERKQSEEWFAAYLGCFRAAGLSVHEMPDGGVQIGDDATSSPEEYERLRRECLAEIGSPPIPAPLTESEAFQLYTWDLDVRKCLIENGFRVTAPGGQAEYVEDVLAQRPPWSPYEGIVLDLPRALEVCPQRVLGEG